MVTQARRDAAWKNLFWSLREVRDILVEDNGDTRLRDEDDPWLAYMIGRVDELIGHWDPDATMEEVQRADKHEQRPSVRKVPKTGP